MKDRYIAILLYTANFFEKDPKVQFWNARGKETLWLFGRLKQGDERYFVCVKENVQKVYSALFYTEKFLLFVVVFPF